jgi:hypothetical protein
MDYSGFSRVIIVMVLIFGRSEIEQDFTDLYYRDKGLYIKLGAPFYDIENYFPEVEKRFGMEINQFTFYYYDYPELALIIQTKTNADEGDRGEYISGVFFRKPIISLFENITIGSPLIDVIEYIDQLENSDVKLNRGFFDNMLAIYIENQQFNGDIELTYEFYFDDNNIIYRIRCETSD